MYPLGRLRKLSGGPTLPVALLLFPAYGLLALWVGHVAGLTPSPHDLLDRPDSWTDKHYPNVAVGYLWTVLLLVGATGCCSVAISGARRRWVQPYRIRTGPIQRIAAAGRVSR